LDTASLNVPGADSPSAPVEGAPEGDLESRLRQALGETYELGPQIGRGGMGVVFQATDLRLKREVAIKVLPPELTHRQDLRRRLVREAQAAAALTHPHIVPIYDVGSGGGLVWFVMAFIHGESLRDLVRRAGPQPLHVVARVLRETAWALSYAHARGIVHRDIKPDNIMIERASGRAIVMDFGLAKIADEKDSGVTSTGAILGTPAYMSPEQARGAEQIDARSDIYTLGLVGYFILTGRNPFSARGRQATLARVLTEEAPDAATLRPDLPAWIIETLRKATRRDPAGRFESAEALANALDQGETPAPIPTSVENFLDLLGSYGALSVLAAWALFFIGLPPKGAVGAFFPSGTFLILVSVLAFPLLRAVHLMSAEGIGWREIRQAIQARRLYWLRTISLARGAGLHLTPMLLVAVAILGVTLNWFFENFQWEHGRYVVPRPVGSLALRSRPLWLILYAALATVVWAWLFALPGWRALSPEKLDAIASWRLPRWIDLLGRVLFGRLGSAGPIVEATADFQQMAEPAVQAAIAFNRTRRQLPLRRRWAVSPVIRQGNGLVRRAWRIQERVVRLKDQLRRAQDPRQADRLAAAIERRETLLAECGAALEDLRLLLEEAASPESAEPPTDPRALEEARRLTRPLRWVARITRAYVVLCIGWLAVRAAVDFEGLVAKVPALGAWAAAGEAFEYVAWGSLPVFVLFLALRRRFYS